MRKHEATVEIMERWRVIHTPMMARTLPMNDLNGIGLMMKPFSVEHNRRAMRYLHDMGIEMTESEVVESRQRAFAIIREEMEKKGWDMPESDEELFFMIKELQQDE